jgi:hypothetical protein
MGAPSTGAASPTPSMTCRSPSSLLSRQALARLLVGVAVGTVLVNVLFLSPLQDVPVHENPYFFSRDSHVLDRPFLGGGPSRNQTGAAASSASSYAGPVDFASFSDEEGQQYIEDIFREAGVDLTPEMRKELPTWREVKEVVGSHPHVLGLESKCAAFQLKVPPLERMLGASGMFNTGTNLVTHLLKQNCEIPERRARMGPKQSKESYGMRWQVPVRETGSLLLHAVVQGGVGAWVAAVTRC